MTAEQKNKVLLLDEKLNVASDACKFMADYLEGGNQLEVFLPEVKEYCGSPHADATVKDFVDSYTKLTEQLRKVFPAVMECVHEYVETTASGVGSII